MRRRHHRGAGAALTRRCCATWPAHAPNGQRCSALPPRCPRAAPALPPTHGLLLATRESLFAPVLYNVCYLRYASHLRRAALLTVHRRAAPLAHRSPPRRSRGLLAAAPPASALITECAARSAPARSMPADAPHATSPPALCLTYGAARSLLPVASRRSIRANSAPRCSRTASRPLAPLASAPLARRITHRTARPSTRMGRSMSIRRDCRRGAAAAGCNLRARDLHTGPRQHAPLPPGSGCCEPPSAEPPLVS